MTTKAEAARGIVTMVTGLMLKLTRSRDLLAQNERFEVAELLRDAADALDQGKVVKITPPLERLLAWHMRRRLVRSRKSEDGMPLFKIVSW